MNGEETGNIAAKREVHEIAAEDIYKVLNELRATAQGVFEQQVAINEKLINAPVDTGEKSTVEADAPVNPRHFPGFRDIAREVTKTLYATQRLQEYLLKHL